ncbi:MAG TPA: hypothetical protein VKX49_29750 [Bryobacteraceae bacterium]|nr:hypothetical protein [Bryobacteraceae bacterium]
MTGVNVPILQGLELKNVAELAGSPGPCVTILLPPYRPGEQTNSPAALLRTYCQEAERQLASRHIEARQVAELLGPLKNLSESPDFDGGSHWSRALFRSEEVFTMLDGLEPLKAGIIIGGCFHLRSVLGDLHLPAVFYVLKLSQKKVELWRCSGLRAERIELPKGVPQSLDEAMDFDKPDHDLENRSAAGSSVGSMRRIRFGTGSGREKAADHVSDFFKAVDRGLHEMVHANDVPLILTGVDEDLAAYRLVSTYPHLLEESIHGSASAPMSDQELLRRAYTILRAEATGRAAATLIEYRERMTPARFSTDLEAILQAAVDGRVGWLFLNEGAQAFGVFEGVRRGGRVNWGEEDLLNVAAVETILRGGSAYKLTPATMPDGAAVAAVFRY